MNDYLLAVILGIVEGLTEFLPVSSTAHLRISEALLHVDLEDGYWKMFSIVIQLGAVMCLPVHFARRISEFAKTFPRGRDGTRTLWNHPLTLTVAAFMTTAIPSFLLVDLIGQNLESLMVMGWSLVIGGVVMWVVDARFNRPRVEAIEQMSLKHAVWIGAVQVLSAIFPGTSRSMSTIAAGQLAGLSRSAALEFSFFVSIPTMFAATLFALYKGISGGSDAFGAVEMTPHRWIVLGIGFIVSFIVAWVVVAWFMAWVRRRGFVPFAIWRLVVGVIVLVWAWQGGTL